MLPKCERPISLGEPIAARCVELHRANVDNLPHGDGQFTKIRTVNTIYFCPSPSAALAELCRVLRVGRSWS